MTLSLLALCLALHQNYEEAIIGSYPRNKARITVKKCRLRYYSGIA
jgi:hypothetical protein